MIIDNNVLTEPRAWEITKVNRISPNGLNRITLAQNLFDEHKDYIEKDENGLVIGKWADYYSSTITPEFPKEQPTTKYAIISYAGTKPQLKVGGSYKTFTINYYNSEGEVITHEVGTWSYYIGLPDGEFTNIDDLEEEIVNIVVIEDNKIKIKFVGTDEYLGYIFKICNTTPDDIEATLEVEVVGI